MVRKKTNTLTPVELEFMQVIWDRGEATSEDMRADLKEQGRDLTGGSVRKVLSILHDKGYVTRTRDGRAYLYRPAVPREEANSKMLRDLLKRAFDGSAAHMVAALLDSRDVDREEIDEIKKMLSERAEEEKQ